MKVNSEDNLTKYVGSMYAYVKKAEIIRTVRIIIRIVATSRKSRTHNRQWKTKLISVWLWCSWCFSIRLASTKHDPSFQILLNKPEGWKGHHFYGRPRVPLSVVTALVALVLFCKYEFKQVGSQCTYGQQICCHVCTSVLLTNMNKHVTNEHAQWWSLVLQCQSFVLTLSSSENIAKLVLQRGYELAMLMSNTETVGRVPCSGVARLSTALSTPQICLQKF